MLHYAVWPDNENEAANRLYENMLHLGMQSIQNSKDAYKVLSINMNKSCTTIPIQNDTLLGPISHNGQLQTNDGMWALTCKVDRRSNRKRTISFSIDIPKKKSRTS